MYMGLEKKWTGGKEGSGNWYFEYTDEKLNKVKGLVSELVTAADEVLDDLQNLIKQLEGELYDLECYIDEQETEEWNTNGDSRSLKVSDTLQNLYDQRDELEEKLSAANDAYDEVRQISMTFIDN